MILDCLGDNREHCINVLIGLCNKEIFPKFQYLVLESILFLILFSMIDSLYEETGQSEWFEALKKIDQHSIRDITIRILWNSHLSFR